MSNNNNRRHWDIVGEKRAAIIAVLKHLQGASDAVRDGCVENDDNLRKLFEDPEIGNIDVPKDVKTVAMPVDERAKKAKGSVVIELPPRLGEEPGEPGVPEPPDPLLVHLLCCYKVW